jgi:hypothetical protein
MFHTLSFPSYFRIEPTFPPCPFPNNPITMNFNPEILSAELPTIGIVFLNTSTHVDHVKVLLQYEIAGQLVKQKEKTHSLDRLPSQELEVNCAPKNRSPLLVNFEQDLKSIKCPAAPRFAAGMPKSGSNTAQHDMTLSLKESELPYPTKLKDPDCAWLRNGDPSPTAELFYDIHTAIHSSIGN